MNPSSLLEKLNRYNRISKFKNNLKIKFAMRNCIFLLVFIFSQSIYCQRYKKPIDYRFKNGENGYSAFFSKSVTYPQASVNAGTVGNSITRVSINPKGEINGIDIINPIDTTIDNMILRAIDQSRNYWRKCDSISHDQKFFIQISFSLPGFYPILFKPKTRALVALFPDPIRITLPDPLLATLSKENEGRIWSIKNEVLTEKANTYLDNFKYEEALPYINELIKRDPFTRDLYKVRIMINIKLNKPELVSSDDEKISDFAEGFSIDELNKDQE